MKRPRGRRRSGGGGNNNNPNRHFESNGPDVKIRGSAQQILDKYLQYARDAQTSGERINSEAYLQHAEHYLRLVAQMQAKQKPKRDDNSDNESDDDQDSASNSDGSGDKSEDSGKKPKGKSEDPLKVIDGEQAEASDGESKPKRRRNYKKKSDNDGDASGDSDDTDDGVMKTLSRGRSEEASGAGEEKAEAPAK